MPIRKTAGLIAGILVAAVAGCSDGTGNVTEPTSIPPPTPGPAPKAQVAGTVTDAASRPLAGAKVEVVDGAGGPSTTTNASGAFQLVGSFTEGTRLRASAAGHVAATLALPPPCVRCNTPFWLFFGLQSTEPAVDLAGDYSLTFEADPGCGEIPEELRSRTYDVTATLITDPDQPANSRFLMTVGGGRLVPGFESFTVGVAGNYLMTDIGEWGHGGAGLVEEIAPNTYVTLGGEFKATVSDPSTIASSMFGAVDRCALSAPWGNRFSCEGAAPGRFHCLSQHHRLVLRRR